MSVIEIEMSTSARTTGSSFHISVRSVDLVMVNHRGKLVDVQLVPNQSDWIQAWLAPAHRQCLPWHQASLRCSSGQVQSWFELSWNGEQFKDMLKSVRSTDVLTHESIVEVRDEYIILTGFLIGPVVDDCRDGLWCHVVSPGNKPNRLLVSSTVTNVIDLGIAKEATVASTFDWVFLQGRTLPHPAEYLGHGYGTAVDNASD